MMKEAQIQLEQNKKDIENLQKIEKDLKTDMSTKQKEIKDLKLEQEIK